MNHEHLMQIAGYVLGAYGFGWGLGYLFLAFEKLTERLK